MYGFLLTINITLSPPGLFDTPYDSHGVFDASRITTPTTRELYSLPEGLLLKVIQFYDALMTFSIIHLLPPVSVQAAYLSIEGFTTDINGNNFVPIVIISYTYYGKSKIVGILLSTISYLVKN